MIRGLVNTTTQEKLTAAIKAVAPYVVSVRLIHDHHTGDSRGFAFAEFSTLEHSSAFFNLLDAGNFMVDDRRLFGEYSHQKGSSGPGRPNKDWICSCGTLNFGRRQSCFSCHKPRGADSQEVQSDAGGITEEGLGTHLPLF